jgi:SprT protein
MKDHLKLLTPELKAKVEAKMKECYKMAGKHYKHKFDFPEVRYDIKNWTGGMAYRNKLLVRFNLILLVENEQHYLESTVPHEVAHMIVNALFAAGKFKLGEGKKRRMPHGAQWKEVMGVLGVVPNVTHSYDCSSIEKSAKRKRKGDAIDRVARILKQVSRLTEEEREDLTYRLENI